MRKPFAKGGVATVPAELALADFGYVIPAHEAPALGPIMTAEQMREIGKEALEEFRPQVEAEPKAKGRHSDTRVSYMDKWAKRYWRSQAGIERARLAKGKARHRAHRDELPIQNPTGDDE